MEIKPQTDNRTFRFKTVMLIDDNPLDNFINKKIIETSFFAENIDIHTHGLSAIGFFNTYEEGAGALLPEVIFVDLNMPVMDGFSFIRGFYDLHPDFAKKCRIVILTSSVNESDKKAARELNPGILFFNKPLLPAHLAAIL
jgi:CheY-like chemotaxis protein